MKNIIRIFNWILYFTDLFTCYVFVVGEVAIDLGMCCYSIVAKKGLNMVRLPDPICG